MQTRSCFQATANHRLDALLHGGATKVSASVLTHSLPEGTLLGRIQIPRLRVSAVIVEGDDASVLRHAVGHIPHTSLPGVDGNVGLAAHRDTFFRSLRDLRENDEIVLTDEQGTQRYRVDRMAIVLPQDIQVLSPVRGSLLTLITCYPFQYVGSAPDRYVVVARPES